METAAPPPSGPESAPESASAVPPGAAPAAPPGAPRRPRSRQEAMVQKLSSTVTFARIAPRLLPRVDRVVHRLTGGKVMISQYMLPSLFLTTTGRRSGEPRVTPLACLPEPGGGFLVIGSNFGQVSHPAWTANLLAEPRASVEHRGRTTAVTARLLEDPEAPGTGDGAADGSAAGGGERAQAWAALLRMWPPYAAYQARVDRRLRIFRLVPTVEAEPEAATGPATGPATGAGA